MNFMEVENIDFLLPINTEPNSNLHGSFCIDLDYEILVCILKNNRWCWEPIKSLSCLKFMEIRVILGDKIRDLINELRQSKQKELKFNKNKNGYHELFAKLSDPEKIDHLKKYTDDILAKTTCIKCFQKVDDKKVCIHKDCFGGCVDCFKIEIKADKEMCNICDREQLLDCPICYIKREKTSLYFLKKCTHYICKECIADAWLFKKPLKECPLCRAKFK